MAPIVHFPLVLIPLWPRCLPQHPVFEHLRLCSLFNAGDEVYTHKANGKIVD